MSESAELMATLLGQIAKTARSLSDEEIKRLASGEAKLAIVSPGYQVLEVTPAVAKSLKLIKSLSKDDVEAIESGESKLAVVPAGHRVIEATPAAEAALKLLKQMSPTDLHQVEERTAKLVLLRKGDKIQPAFDPAQVAEQVSVLASEAEIVRLLDEDSRLTAANLKKVAAELTVTVPSNVKSKPALQLHIAQAVIRDRDRWSLR